MTTETLTIDKTGRVVLPKPVRDQLGLVAGSELQLTATADRITLEPKLPRAALQRRGKLLVHTGKGSFDIVAEIQRGRDERSRQMAGPGWR
ncbi:MAG: AbrB/MazE/SpoVT family DNA-binding domain-containing protein [Opitutus sp.]|nr:AbrB/MazE/SpoVT family DNA-binding domain-containing protein [Opitutus sp.]